MTETATLAAMRLANDLQHAIYDYIGTQDLSIAQENFAHALDEAGVAAAMNELSRLIDVRNWDVKNNMWIGDNVGPWCRAYKVKALLEGTQEVSND